MCYEKSSFKKNSWQGFRYMAFIVSLWEIYLCLSYKSYDPYLYYTADKMG